MTTTIEWFGGAGSPEILPAASGGLNTVGFFGSSFGFSIRVSEYNNTTYLTNANGTSNGGQLPNLRWANTSGAFVGPALNAVELRNVQQAECTLKITLTTDNPIGTQNTNFRAFDRISINNNPSGVTIQAAEIRKTGATLYGSGDINWTAIAGSGSVLSLADKVTEAPATEHNWYVGLSATPGSIGEKTEIALYFETEFL